MISGLDYADSISNADFVLPVQAGKIRIFFIWFSCTFYYFKFC